MPNSNLEGRRTGRIDPVDAHVGARLRMRRALMGMSQEQLGATVGISFQQVQKYERGLNDYRPEVGRFNRPDEYQCN